MDNQSFTYTNSAQPSSGSIIENKPTPAPTLALEPTHAKTPIGIIVGLIIAIVFAVGLGVLSIILFIKYQEASTNLDGQISDAVAIAVKEKADILEAEFAEREKSPYETFAGPADYGELSFKYPKTWSVYIEQDASSGGDFKAYLNPVEVNPVSNNTVNSLRVEISNSSFDRIVSGYSSLVSSQAVTSQAITVNGHTAQRYDGTFSDGLVGSVVIIKIRDKTAILRTDSQLFAKDFDELIKTVRFNS